MDLDKLRQTYNDIEPADNIVAGILSRFPKEDEILKNDLSALNLNTSINQIKAPNHTYTFCIDFDCISKPEGIYLDPFEAYYYVLNEEDKTITQLPKFKQAIARFYPAEILHRNSTDRMDLSDAITFKATTISVSDKEIEGFKRYAKTNKGFAYKAVMPSKYSKYATLEEALSIFKPLIEGIPENVLTNHSNAYEIERYQHFVSYYTVYTEGSKEGLLFLAEQERDDNIDKVIDDPKRIGTIVLNALENNDFGDKLEALFYEFFGETAEGKKAPELYLSFAVYFDKNDEGDNYYLDVKYQGSEVVVTTPPLKVLAVLSAGTFGAKVFDWDFMEINIPDLHIPISENLVNHKYEVYLHSPSSGSLFSYDIIDDIARTIKPILIENKIKGIDRVFQLPPITGLEFNYAGVTYKIQNPLVQGD